MFAEFKSKYGKDWVSAWVRLDKILIVADGDEDNTVKLVLEGGNGGPLIIEGATIEIKNKVENLMYDQSAPRH